MLAKFFKIIYASLTMLILLSSISEGDYPQEEEKQQHIAFLFFDFILLLQAIPRRERRGTVVMMISLVHNWRSSEVGMAEMAEME